MSTNITLASGVDRIHLVRHISWAIYKLIGSQLWGLYNLVKNKNILVKSSNVKFKITIKSGAHGLRLGYYPEKKGAKLADLIICKTKINMGYFKLCLYPGHFPPQEYEVHFAELENLMAVFLPVSYAEMYEHAKVSYIELASDNGSQKMGTFLVSRPKVVQSSRFLEKDGSLGTHYLGAKNGVRRDRIYDKNRQMAKIGKSRLGTWTRFEVSIRNTGLHVWELGEKLGNPFLSMHVADLAKAYSFTNDVVLLNFLKYSESVGTATALKHQMPKYKVAARKLLKLARATWWKPVSVGKFLQTAFEQFTPQPSSYVLV
ncbi:hypothetical protein [Rhodoferax sp. WC2427]|uniref:hypothetical protein n=1 Tax=Rhodoferax sp. WC2427 TaxID=3234144 RepID=UPI0034659B20